MKNILFLTLVLGFSTSCKSPNYLKKFDKQSKFSENKSVLGLNAVNADNSYYTRAILDYLLVKKILESNSITKYGLPNNVNPNQNLDSLFVQKRILFPQLQFDLDSKPNHIDTQNLRKFGVKSCIYDIPTTLNDLKSGFQFNHYVFKSSNRAALQAFGIVNSEAKESSLYIVTDYIQYQDINCNSLPTIRYAIGIRAEFKIQGIESESELKSTGSLAGLAAEVELKKQQVNITIKTIGITGVESRLTIPSNTSFDVKTYSEYEKVIDFIRNLENGALSKENLIVEPQIIPVMDEYRTTIDHSLYPIMESIEVLELKLNEFKKNLGIDDQAVNALETEINDLKLQLIKEEVNKIISNRNLLIKIENDINSFPMLIQLYDSLKELPLDDKEMKLRLQPN